MIQMREAGEPLTPAAGQPSFTAKTETSGDDEGGVSGVH